MAGRPTKYPLNTMRIGDKLTLSLHKMPYICKRIEQLWASGYRFTIEHDGKVPFVKVTRVMGFGEGARDRSDYDRDPLFD